MKSGGKRMGSRIGKAALIFLMFILSAAILEAGAFVTSTGEKTQVLPPHETNASNPVEGQNVKPGDSNPDPQDLPPCIVSLPTNPPDYYDLYQYQTSVKDQNPRGSCTTHAWIGAMEAAYKRKYGLELDLSEEYLIHAVFTTQHSNNPNLLHPIENLISECTVLLDEKDPQANLFNPIIDAAAGAIIYVAVTVPKEKYAPYFGTIHDGSAVYPNHSHSDLVQIQADSNIWLKDANGTLLRDKNNNPICNPHRTQQDVDSYEYDIRHIPLEARKNAIYGVTDMLRLNNGTFQDTDILERFIYSGQEVSIGFVINNLVCSGKHIYGYSTCAEVTNQKPGDLPPCGLGGCGGHQMLLVGYDRKNQLFLFKNSWGSTNPYAWLSYDFIKKYANGAQVVREVRDPNLGPSEEAMWTGKWKMDHDGWLGDLVIRRMKKTPVEMITLLPSNYENFTCIRYKPSSDQERLGTYYGSDGVAREVKGRINPETKDAEFYIDFVHPEPPPYGTYTVSINPGDQPFELELFTGGSNPYTFGNFSAGLTTWSGVDYGALTYRPDIEMTHPPGTFSIDQWKDRFKLYSTDGSRAILEITDIGAVSIIGYPVTFKYNGTPGTGLISNPDTQRLTSFSQELDLYYHSRETGILSGLGVFGRRTADLGVAEVSASDGAYSDKVQITWATLAGAKTYVVYTSTSPSGTKENLSGQIKSTKFAHKTAVPGQVYYYWVAAVGEDGDWTDWSDYDSGYRKLAAPAGVAASDGTYTDKVLITWKPVQGAVLYYTVVRKEEISPGNYKVLGSTDTTSFNDTTAIPGFPYSYTVNADSFYGSSDSSKSDKGYRKLAAPTNVVASDADAPLVMDKVLISWSGVPGATSYSIYRAPSSSHQKPTLLGTVTTMPYEDSTGTPELIYNYFVKANIAYGSSDLSAPDAGHRKLPAPTGVSASDGTYEDKVLVTWNPVNGATSYQIFRAEGMFDAKTQLGTVTGQSKTSFNDTTATLGTFYYYWVKAVSKNGASDFSDPWDTGYRKQLVPSGVSASDGTYPDKVRVTWNPVQGAAQYLIYRSTSGTGGQVNIGGSVATTYDDTSASPGTTYYYWVRALWSFMGTMSDYSAPDAGWLAAQISSPPTLLSPANGATDVSTNPTLNWSASVGATSYQLQVSTDSNFATKVFDQSGITGTSQVVNGLHGGKIHYWRTNATNTAGTSQWSDVYSFTTGRE
jgi:fibronectin type 3 domain-containing protein